MNDQRPVTVQVLSFGALGTSQSAGQLDQRIQSLFGLFDPAEFCGQLFRLAEGFEREVTGNRGGGLFLLLEKCKRPSGYIPPPHRGALRPSTAQHNRGDNPDRGLEFLHICIP